MKIIVLISFFMFNFVFAKGFELNYQKETAFAFFETSILTFAFLAHNNKTTLNSTTVDSLNSNSINYLDKKFAIFSFDKDLADISDLFLIGISSSPFLFFISNDFRKNKKLLIPILFAETVALNTGINFIVKNMVSRKRPYAYEIEKNYKKRTSPDATRSFYSGHSSLAFASATFSTAMFFEYFPNSKWKIPVASSLFSSALIIASLRVLSGEHFLSDVSFGALMGVSSSLFVLMSHKKKDFNFSFFPLNNGGLFSFNYIF
jgi:membrane-associated phospholipid phosphatase